MRALKFIILLASFFFAGLSLADDVPIVDGYDNNPPNASSQDNSSANQASSAQSFGAGQAASSANFDASPALPVDQRIAILERQVSSLTQLLKQTNTLQQQVQELRGQLETQNHQLETLQNQVKTQYQDLDQRMGQAANNTPSTPTDKSVTEKVAKQPTKTKTIAKSSATTVSHSTDDAAVVNDNSDPDEPIAHNVKNNNDDSAKKTDDTAATAKKSVSNADDQAAYQAAFNLLKSKKYNLAADSFQDFIKKYPTSKNMVNAHYWLGQLNLLQGQPDKAINQFKAIVKNSPNDPKVPDAMVQLGLAYYAKGNSALAKTELAKVQQKYPDSAAAKLAKTRLSQMDSSTTNAENG